MNSSEGVPTSCGASRDDILIRGKHKHIRESEKCQNMSNVVEKLVPRQDLLECLICARHFTSDRIKAHEIICKKTSGIKRKSFDISKQRISGTEAEQFSKMVARKECLNKLQNNCTRGLSTNWRRKREDFLKKVKSAKEVANEKCPKGDDLPFPPAHYDKDYVQCPHCLRKFNSMSAARHIAICAKRMCISKSKTNLADDLNPAASESSVPSKKMN